MSAEIIRLPRRYADHDRTIRASRAAYADALVSLRRHRNSLRALAKQALFETAAKGINHDADAIDRAARSLRFHVRLTVDR